MIKIYRKVFSLLSGRERKRYLLLGGIMVLMSCAELFGISAVLILLNVFAEPDSILGNHWGGWLFNKLGFATIFSFQIFLTLIVLGVLTISQVFKAGGSYAMIRFGMMRGYAISSRLLTAILQQPYSWFLQRNSSEISKNILSDVSQLVYQVLIPSLQLVANLFTVIVILAFLFFVDPIITITSVVLVGGGYGGVYFFLRGLLTRLGKEALEMDSVRYRLIQEATGGIKELKMLGLESSFISRFERAALNYARIGSNTQAISQIPRFFMEAVVITLLLCALLFMAYKTGGNITEAIPILGAFAFAAMRLLPVMQQSYLAFASLRSGEAVLNLVVDEYRGVSKGIPEYALQDKTPSNSLTLNKAFDLVNTSFTYHEANKPALEKINISIEAHTTVGIVGGTGAGKTTLIDLILGLLTPNGGKILIDGERLVSENLKTWRRMIGYVPQTIYLTDNTIAENIAFGLPHDKIDMKAVERAARIAALHDFIVTELSDGYKTVVGERGVRLSGGQRQRIGIARALYYDPALLVLDEATSALDNVTERAIIESIDNIGHSKTIIMIAHRLSTIKKCDRIFVMRSGRIAATGTYQELIQSDEDFRKMAHHEER